MPLGLSASELSPGDAPDSPASGFPDPALIARMANAFFQAPPTPAGADPGVPVAPPSPSMIPAPDLATSVAPFTPANPLVGPPDLPPSTIPSIVPTPNLTLPHAPSFSALPGGYGEPPLPGASVGAVGAPFQLGESAQLVPEAHRANPGGLNADSPYFLSETAFAQAPAASAPAPAPASAAAEPPAASVPAAPASGGSPESVAPESLAPKGSYSFLELDLRPLVAPTRGAVGFPLDPETIKRDFPILNERVHGKRLVWLDNAATTQKPLAVIERISDFYKHENSNIHRAAHALAARATDAYEAAREKVRRFLNAPSARDIIFVRGATEGVNFVAQSWGRANVQEGDEILVTHLEHHANIVPWQQLCAQTGAKLRVAPVDDDGQVDLAAYEKLLGPKTKIVAFTQVSNALGTVTPVAEMTALAHRHGACVLVDGAQSVSHMPVDVQAIGCDFFVFSGHKVFGPTGIGAVYGREAVLEKNPPWQGGGNMIADVTFERTLFNPPPERFEAGTGNIADAVGLGAAIDYVENLGMANIGAYEHGLLEYATAKMVAVPGLRMIGTAREKASVLSFVLQGKEPIEVGKALDKEGIAVRAGHHCAQPILRRFGLEATVRPSLAFYNTCEDVDLLVDVLHALARK
ncbi:cysteine desulfurase/selenocysteine lyase [Rhodoblastus acidophilus]|uniref:family 2A encapsulin nanocompartment cargo protein cysteine desulfurase n=1 Tax=Rhodoblastus acidophilus TaxID=1074 RepID=UPI002223F73A|nr:family 2A encapsulin nanocompartment cargo protein cysteine desulfurase [Rhodoblastus acidophilus]MCW2283440.1 cysteine desulfurase/selenocysteine lyase [Rhodoblastus acidophilus]MCW2332236.1 cysteine desulfurase/selenocysteine lyase [Rhodoblastus acidophilus]